MPKLAQNNMHASTHAPKQRSDLKPTHLLTTASTKLPILDFLRAFAVMLVVWYHLWQLSFLAPSFHVGSVFVNFEFLPAIGFVGVDLFIFISGFCLAALVWRENTFPHTKSFWQSFARNRALKILPSYYASMALIVGWFYLTKRDLPNSWDIISHVFFIHNLFPGTSGSINGVYWSLGPEIQFYVLFPLIMYAVHKRPWMMTIALVTVANVFRFYFVYNDSPMLSFYINQLPGFLDMYAIGVLAAKYTLADERVGTPSSNMNRLYPSLSLLGISFFIGAVMYCYHIRYEDNALALWSATFRTPIAIAVALTVIFWKYAPNVLQWFSALSIWRFLSVISFNLYLWHQFLMFEFWHLKIPAAVTADPHADLDWQRSYFALCLVLSLVVATLATWLIELPFLRRKKK